jgi:hypothetical protein
MTGALAGLGATLYAAFALNIGGLVDIARRPRLDRTAPTGRLSERDMATILALLEVLVPLALWPSREVMAAMVHEATEQRQGVLKEYQAGLAFLDQTASVSGVGPSFAQAGFEERQRILESLLWKYDSGTQGILASYVAKLHRGLEWVLQSETERRFRELMVRDLLRRFYGGPAAWALAAYSRRPGIPGDPREYVHPLRSKP